MELSDFSHEEDVRRRVEDEARRADDRASRDELRRLTSAAVTRRALLDSVSEMAARVVTPTLEKLPTTKGGRPTHHWVLVLSDIHVGQKTTAESTGQLFEQSTEITRHQFAGLRHALERLAGIARASLDVPTLHILCLGDLVDGDSMRVSQARKVDLLVGEQTVEATKLLSGLIQHGLTLFQTVELDMVGGNHDRMSQKPGDAGLGELGYVDTFSFVVGAMLGEIHRPAVDEGRFVLTNHESYWGAKKVLGWRFAYEHGASFKSATGSYGGVGYYGIANAARGYVEMLDGADFVVMGHFHRAMLLPMGRGWQVLNGSFPPSSTFIQSRYKAITRPMQTLLSIHKEYGLVGWTPIFLEHPDLLRPGEFWDGVQ